MSPPPPARRNRSQRKITVAAVDDFPPGTRMEVQVGRALIAVFNVGGDFYALYGRCPHHSAPLSRGRLQGTVICNADTDWETEWAHDGEVLVCPATAWNTTFGAARPLATTSNSVPTRFWWRTGR